MVQAGQEIELKPIRKIGEEEEELKPVRKTEAVKSEDTSDLARGFSKATGFAPAKRKPTPSPLSPEYWRGVSSHIEKIPGAIAKGIKKIPEIGPAVMDKANEALEYVREHPQVLTKTTMQWIYEASPYVQQIATEQAKSIFETVTHPFSSLYNDPVRFASDAAIVLGGAVKGATLAAEYGPKVGAAVKRIQMASKAGKAPVVEDLEVIAKSMVDDAAKYESRLKEILVTSGRKPEEVDTWVEMSRVKVPQKESIVEVALPRGKKKPRVVPTKVKPKKTKTVEQVVQEPVPKEVPVKPEILDIPSSAMGMSLEDFEAAQKSGEIITNVPRYGQDKMYTAGGDLKEAISGLVAPARKALKQTFHSPDVVLSKSPQTAENYMLLDSANLNKTRWLNANSQRADEARRFIKKNSPLDHAISKTRNLQLGIDDALKLSDDGLQKAGFSAKEISDLRAYPDLAKKFDDYLDKTFDGFLRQWGITKVTAGEETKLWNMANASRSGQKITEKTLAGLTPEAMDVFTIYQKRIPKYLTRLFPKKDALEFLQQEMANIESILRKIKPTSRRFKYWNDRKAESLASMEKINTAKNPLDVLGPEAKAAYERMYGGEPVFFDYLPKRVSNKFFNRRLGKEGYDPSSVKSFYTYMSWISKKIFDEPVVKYIHSNWDKVPMDMREYMKWYVQDYMGYLRNPLDSVYANIKSLMWTRALGFNPRSAVVNMTQRINILADSHPADTWNGWKNGFTKEGKELFEMSGLGLSVPQVMAEGGELGSTPLEAFRNLAGLLFSRAEMGNLKHAFLSGVEEAKRMGKVTLSEQIARGILKAEKTQFRYGKIGNPRALRGAGGVVMQFWSYPIKQLEFLTKLYKENKWGLVKWFILSEGANQTFQEFLDTDLSNALGVGVNWGEMIAGIDALAEGDTSEFFYRLTKRGGLISGGGLLPYGLGPAVEFAGEAKDAAGKLVQALIGQEGWDEAFGATSQALEPGVSKRVRQGLKAFKEGPDEEGLYPIRKTGSGYLQYREPKIDLVKRTILGRPMTETRQTREMREKIVDTRAINTANQRIADLIVQGKSEQAERISKAWGGAWPSKAGIKAAFKRYLGQHPKDTKTLRRFRAMFLEEYE